MIRVADCPLHNRTDTRDDLKFGGLWINPVSRRLSSESS